MSSPCVFSVLSVKAPPRFITHIPSWSRRSATSGSGSAGRRLSLTSCQPIASASPARTSAGRVAVRCECRPGRRMPAGAADHAQDRGRCGRGQAQEQGKRADRLAGQGHHRTAAGPPRLGRLLKPDAVSRRFKVLARESCLPPIKLHEGRHSAASLARDAEVDPEIRRKTLGHADQAMTSHYTHIEAAAHRAEAVAQLVEGAESRPSLPPEFPGAPSPAVGSAGRSRLAKA